jgi:hypothetical protein
MHNRIRSQINYLEIELAHHGGNDNGRLPVTYEDFIEYGMPPSTERAASSAENCTSGLPRTAAGSVCGHRRATYRLAISGNVARIIARGFHDDRR